MIAHAGHDGAAGRGINSSRKSSFCQDAVPTKKIKLGCGCTGIILGGSRRIDAHRCSRPIPKTACSYNATSAPPWLRLAANMTWSLYPFSGGRWRIDVVRLLDAQKITVAFSVELLIPDFISNARSMYLLGAKRQAPMPFQGTCRRINNSWPLRPACLHR